MNGDQVHPGTFSWKSAQGKHFVVRSSPVTQLLKNPEARNLYHMVLVAFGHFVVLEILLELAETGSVDLGWTNFATVFGSPLLTSSVVLALHLLPILVFYPVFLLWANLRFKVQSHPWRKLLDAAYYLSVTLIFTAAFYTVFNLRFDYALPVGSATIWGAEGSRILMKMYAFARTNTPRVQHWTLNHGQDDQGHDIDSMNNIKVNGHPDKNSIAIAIKYNNAQDIVLNPTLVPMLQTLVAVKGQVNSHAAYDNADEFPYFDEKPYPSFTSLCYFLYAPTLVYRDNYPRTPTRSWTFILGQTFNFLGIVFLYFLAHRKFGYIMLQDFGVANHQLNPVELVKILMGQFILGLFAYVFAVILVLHCFQNIFAELLRFGDRYFYADWWSATNFSEYHRKWNYVICDWLYVYVYRDVRNLKISKKIKSLPAITVLILSALYHELGACFILKFFCPAMIILFGGPGIILTFVGNKNFPRLGNAFLHWGLGLGCAFMHLLYAMEYFARVNNCPPSQTPLADFFVPRFPYCSAFQWNVHNLTSNL